MSPEVFPLARERQLSPVNFLQLTLTLLLPLFLLTNAFGQANVNESLETAYIYVDTATGSDSNSGTQQKPLKTIGKAASMAETNNQSGIGSRVIINPGTYRESIKLTKNNKDTSLPITFEAATNGTVIVSGATVYSGWGTYSLNNSIYTNSWTNNWGECPQLSTCPYQQKIMMRQEMVAVNGTALTQVMSLGQMLQGTFYVDENANQIYVWPKSGTNIGTATVEIASTPTLFTIQNKTNIVVRGLTFQYANTCRAEAAVVVQGSSSNILFDTDTFQWNNGQGLAIENPTTYFTVENSISQHNGDAGFQESQTRYGLWQSDTTSYNNWRGAQAGYYTCNTGGLHAWEVHDDTINGLTVSFNEAYGIHWDTDNANISTSGINATSNLMSGLFVEKDEGPVTFDKTYVCHQNSAMAVGGLVLRNTEGVSLTNSVLMDNLSNQITVIGLLGGISVTNWVTGKTTNLYTQNFTNQTNTIQGNTSSQGLFKDSYLNGTDWTNFQTTLKSSGNTWWNSQNSTTEFVVPTPKKGTKDDFSGWKGATSQDSSSSFKQPASGFASACNLTPVGTDFWFTVDNAALTVSPGKSVTFNLTLTPLNFTGTANITLDGITEVKGLSSKLSTSSIKTSGTSALTVTASSTTAAGTYLITILANSGSITRTVTVQLTVS
jgi:Protein of unknown function (DUF1565)